MAGSVIYETLKGAVMEKFAITKVESYDAPKSLAGSLIQCAGVWGAAGLLFLAVCC